jgi:DNA-binding transcriptional ArsR family regulator
MTENDSDTLKSVQGTVEDIRAILVLAFQDKLIEKKKELLREGSVKKHIYELCDGARSREEIARALKKSADYVSSYLTRLRREGLIHAVEKEGQEVYEQVF